MFCRIRGDNRLSRHRCYTGVCAFGYFKSLGIRVIILLDSGICRNGEHKKINMRIRPVIYLCITLIVSSGVPGAEEERRFSGIEGEYRGTIKRTEMTLWAAVISGQGEERGLALMFFPSEQRLAQEDRLRRLTDALLAPGQDRCDLVNVYDQVHRSEQGPGLMMILGDWEQQPELGISRFPQGYWMMNDEYIFLRGREYMVKQVRRSAETGELKSLRLTRTGFIQNFFDNPTLRLERVGAGTGELRLLADYVRAKSSALKALDAAIEGVPQDSVPPCP